MKAIKISDNIYWVGAIDWDVRNFHGYLTQRGTTYNAYLIIDKKITLIDLVKPAFTNQLIERISSVINPEKIDYIVSNHVEMDYSGALPAIMKYTPDAEYICVGSPTLNKNIMPSVAGFLTYLNGLAPGNKKAISFGSYGWGEQIKKTDNYLENTGFEIIESVKHKYIPNSEDLLRIKNNIIEKIK